MKKIVFIRADSSSQIGTGHIMRCLVLAEQYIGNGNEVYFLTKTLDGNLNQKISDNGFQIIPITSSDFILEAEEVSNWIKDKKAALIIFDHYAIDYEYEQIVKETTNIKILSLDDTYEKHCCDILLNHNIYADETRYQGLVPDKCELKCGANYTLLRNEFINEKQKRKLITNNDAKTVLIAMGGADHTNKNIEILKVLESFPNIHAAVVTTTANRYLAELNDYAQGKNNITLHINTNQMAKLMHKADFAIVTPSVTMNEVFYMKLPFIAIRTVKNQNEMYEYLIKKNSFILDYFDYAILKDTVEKMIDFLKIRLINFTDLSLEEKKIILTWRNNLDIKKWMFSQTEIKLDEHLKYIDSLQEKQDKLYFLVKNNYQNIGVIDFTNINLIKKSAEFGLYGNPNLKGVGKILMQIICEYAFNKLKLNKLIAEVFSDNEKAINVYKNFKFQKIGENIINTKKVVCMELINENR